MVPQLPTAQGWHSLSISWLPNELWTGCEETSLEWVLLFLEPALFVLTGDLLPTDGFSIVDRDGLLVMR